MKDYTPDRWFRNSGCDVLQGQVGFGCPVSAEYILEEIAPLGGYVDKSDNIQGTSDSYKDGAPAKLRFEQWRARK